MQEQIEDLDSEDFLELVKKTKPKTMDYERNFKYFPFLVSHMEHIFYVKGYRFSTNCDHCANELQNLFEKMGITILNI